MWYILFNPSGSIDLRLTALHTSINCLGRRSNSPERPLLKAPRMPGDASSFTTLQVFGFTLKARRRDAVGSCGNQKGPIKKEGAANRDPDLYEGNPQDAMPGHLDGSNAG